MNNLYRRPTKDASYQISIHLAKRLQWRRFFLEINQLEKKLSVADKFDNVWEEMNNLYTGPAIDASFQVSVHLANWFQRRRLKNISQSDTRIAYGGHVC